MITDKPQTTTDKPIDTVINLSLNIDADKAAKFIRGLLYKYNLDSRPLTVLFDGYNDDPREIWEIDRCVSVCQAVQDAGLFPHLTIDCAWLFYKVANRLFIRGQPTAMFMDSDWDRFELLYRGIPEAIR